MSLPLTAIRNAVEIHTIYCRVVMKSIEFEEGPAKPLREVGRSLGLTDEQCDSIAVKCREEVSSLRRIINKTAGTKQAWDKLHGVRVLTHENKIVVI